MLRLYARREANCLPDDPQRRLLTRARNQMERVTPGFKRNALGVPAFLLGGAVFSTLMTLIQRALFAAISAWWTQVLATIVIGLLPIMLGSGTGSEVMRRIAAPMVGGMISATLLALTVIPALYIVVNPDRSRP